MDIPTMEHQREMGQYETKTRLETLQLVSTVLDHKMDSSSVDDQVDTSLDNQVDTSLDNQMDSGLDNQMDTSLDNQMDSTKVAAY